MPLISSPVTYPASSSPAAAKRSKPHAEPAPRIRAKAGFLLDDDSEDEDELPSPAAKRRMLSSPREGQPPKSTQPSSPPPQIVSGSKSADSVFPPAPVVSPSEENSARVLDFLPIAFTARKPPVLDQLPSCLPQSPPRITTCSGKTVHIGKRKENDGVSYERIVAARSKTKKGRAERSYYGIDIHDLINNASKELADQAGKPTSAPDNPIPSVEDNAAKRPRRTLLWTEKYRARNFVDLVGDDQTNRQVLKWLKRWEPIVFPGASRSRHSIRRPGVKNDLEDEKPHRKILMLTGPPGLGKTTLAHVCAKQAGYEVMEINASDDRSRDVVKNRIRTSLGTENVKTVQHAKAEPGRQQKAVRPVCVVVDEVDGVVTGSGGSGEGGFIKALMDLITTGEKNAAGQHTTQQAGKRNKKGDDFRQMRPLVLICNDVYHVSLRPLRQSGLAEIIHVGKPTVDAVVGRLKSVFEKEGIPCEKDAARKICESAWGITNGLDAKRGAESTAEGDLRGIMVVGEWVAGRLKAAALRAPLGLTKQWVEQHVVRDLAHGGGGARGMGRGSTRDIVTRVFQDGAGFPKANMPMIAPSTKNLHEQPQAQLGFAEQQRRYGIERLREMVETSGDIERVLTEVFSDYPNHEFNDDSFLTKPNQAYEWMHFHDTCSSRIFGSQEWELGPYLCQPILACHSLFATPIRRANAAFEKKWGDNSREDEVQPLPFSGPRADFAARESEKENRSMLQALQAQLPPTLMRSFRSAEDVSTEFLPYLIRMVSPEVKPVVVGGSGDARGTASVRKDTEKAMVQRAASILAEIGVELRRGKIEDTSPFGRPAQWVYRMEPDLDILATFESSAAVLHGTQAPTRYAVRQVLDQELQKANMMRDNLARQSRFKAGNPQAADYLFDNKENVHSAAKTLQPSVPVKRDFFGRVIRTDADPLSETSANTAGRSKAGSAPLGKAEKKVWVTYHEGLNNAVRKPITLDEFLKVL